LARRSNSNSFRYSEGWMQLAYFDYHLPEELIARKPWPTRRSRLLVVHRDRGCWKTARFATSRSTCTRAIAWWPTIPRLPRRLFGHRAGVQRACPSVYNPKIREILEAAPSKSSLLRSVFRRRPRLGRASCAQAANCRSANAYGSMKGGRRDRRSLGSVSAPSAFTAIGISSPPSTHWTCPAAALHSRRADSAADRDRYQTVSPREELRRCRRRRASLHAGSAGPCRAAGAEQAFVTLHVGLGTFQPLHEKWSNRPTLHTGALPHHAEAATRCAAARHVVAVGTTSVPYLGNAARTGSSKAKRHLPLSWLPFLRTGAFSQLSPPPHQPVLLVCAFAGTDVILGAYRTQWKPYRFYSYGDCMLIV